VGGGDVVYPESHSNILKKDRPETVGGEGRGEGAQEVWNSTSMGVKKLLRGSSKRVPNKGRGKGRKVFNLGEKKKKTPTRGCGGTPDLKLKWERRGKVVWMQFIVKTLERKGKHARLIKRERGNRFAKGEGGATSQTL